MSTTAYDALYDGLRQGWLLLEDLAPDLAGLQVWVQLASPCHHPELHRAADAVKADADRRQERAERLAAEEAAAGTDDPAEVEVAANHSEVVAGDAAGNDDPATADTDAAHGPDTASADDVDPAED